MLTLKDFNELSNALWVDFKLEFDVFEKVDLQEFKEIVFGALEDTNIQHSITWNDIAKENES